MRRGVFLVAASLFAVGVVLSGCGSSDKSDDSNAINQQDNQVEVLSLSTTNKDDRYEKVSTSSTNSSTNMGSSNQLVSSTSPMMIISRYIYKTGQMVSYDANDDGANQSGIETDFQRDDQNEIVIDNIRGLIWQDNDDVNSNEMKWDEAVEYCSNLSLAGRSDWRLPNSDEIMSIVDYSQLNYSIDSAFVNRVKFDYWLSNSFIYDPNRKAFRVSFNGGYIDVGYKQSSPIWSLGMPDDTWTKFNVRCVSGIDKNDQKINYTRDNGSGIVTDPSTMKMWQDNRDARYKKLTYSQAIEYCNNLTLGGYSDWKLPNKNELLSILDVENFMTNWQLLDKSFKNVNQWSPYVTSSTFVRDESMAWGVQFGSGRNYLLSKHKYNLYAVRCMRDISDAL